MRWVQWRSRLNQRFTSCRSNQEDDGQYLILLNKPCIFKLQSPKKSGNIWHANHIFSISSVPIYADMESALTAAVEPARRVRGIKNKDINPVCSLSLSPGRSGSDLPGCLWGPTVSPETRSACSLSRAQKGLSLRRICVCAQLCCSYPPSAKASARTSVLTITDSQVINACFEWRTPNGILVSESDLHINRFSFRNCRSTSRAINVEITKF